MYQPTEQDLAAYELMIAQDAIATFFAPVDELPAIAAELIAVEEARAAELENEIFN